MKEYTKEEMIQKIKDIAAKENTNKVPRHLFFRETGISERKMLALFGSYNNLIVEADLEPHIFPSRGQKIHTDAELIKEVIRVCRIPHAKLSRLYFDQNSTVSSSACERRFGGWINTLKLVLEKLDLDSDKEIIQKIKEYTEINLQNTTIKKYKGNSIDTEVVNGGETINTEIISEKLNSASTDAEIYEYDSSNIYGDFINFRGLQHAPVNEQGVVFLFGMICKELGYIVEIVRQGFPDCEAKRKIKNKPGKWQKVRIEFEFQSRTFKMHGHDPNICDVIVCWEHNWPDCPIEVIELKNIIKRINKEAAE